MEKHDTVVEKKIHFLVEHKPFYLSGPHDHFFFKGSKSNGGLSSLKGAPSLGSGGLGSLKGAPPLPGMNNNNRGRRLMKEFF